MTSQYIFICGTGRSGTHLIGRTIATHPEIEGRIESQNTFKLITKIATTQDFENKIFTLYRKRKLNTILKSIQKKSSSSYILEKSHPSLWLFEEIRAWFPKSKFIGVYRDVLPTVSSMMKHKGVSSWFSKLPLNKPNKFIGINERNIKFYSDLSLEEKCAARWLSHYNELHRLKKTYPNEVMLVNYENFVKDVEIGIDQIASFLSLSNNFNPEEINKNSLVKWNSNLTKNNILKIKSYIAKFDKSSEDD